MARAIFTVVLLGLMTAAPADAQQRLFATEGSGRWSKRVWEGTVDNGRVSGVVLRTTTVGGPGRIVVVGGGEFLTWPEFYSLSTSSPLVVLDRDHSEVYTFWPRLDPGSAAPPVADPTRLQLFVPGSDGILRLTPTGFSALPATQHLTAVAVSPDGSRLYATRVVDPGPPRLDEVHVLDTATGLLLNSFTGGMAVSDLTPSTDNRSVWVLSTRDGTPRTRLIRQIDTSSGQELQAMDLPVTPDPSVAFHAIVGVDETRRRIVVRTSPELAPQRGTTIIATYDTMTGAMVGHTTLEGSADAGLDAGAGTVLVLANHQAVCTLLSISTMTGQVMTSQPLGTIPALGSVSFGVPPLPPVLDTPEITPSRSVTLRWARSPEVTREFIVEAGSAPGRSDLARLPGLTGTTLTVPNVPPGTYYVRVKARNHIGPSLASNEIAITVP